jgi:hypothetical protein
VFEKLHEGIYATVEKLDDDLRKRMKPFTKRWSPSVLKIAMLMQPFFCFDSDELSADAIIAGGAVINYAIKSTVFMFANHIGESDQQKKQRILLEYISMKGGKIERYRLLQSKKLKGGSREYDGVLDTLIDSNRIGLIADKVQNKNVYFLITERDEKL